MLIVLCGRADMDWVTNDPENVPEVRKLDTADMVLRAPLDPEGESYGPIQCSSDPYSDIDKRFDPYGLLLPGNGDKNLEEMRASLKEVYEQDTMTLEQDDESASDQASMSKNDETSVCVKDMYEQLEDCFRKFDTFLSVCYNHSDGDIFVLNDSGYRICSLRFLGTLHELSSRFPRDAFKKVYGFECGISVDLFAFWQVKVFSSTNLDEKQLYSTHFQFAQSMLALRQHLDRLGCGVVNYPNLMMAVAGFFILVYRTGDVLCGSDHDSTEDCSVAELLKICDYAAERSSIVGSPQGSFIPSRGSFFISCMRQWYMFKQQLELTKKVVYQSYEFLMKHKKFVKSCGFDPKWIEYPEGQEFMDEGDSTLVLEYPEGQELMDEGDSTLVLEFKHKFECEPEEDSQEVEVIGEEIKPAQEFVFCNRVLGKRSNGGEDVADSSKKKKEDLEYDVEGLEVG